MKNDYFVSGIPRLSVCGTCYPEMCQYLPPPTPGSCPAIIRHGRHGGEPLRVTGIDGDEFEICTEEDVIDANKRLLDAIASGDYRAYSDLTAPDLTAIDPESSGYPVHGQAFHKYYFDLSSHPKMAQRKGAQTVIPNVITMSNPHVRWLGGEGGAAVITYVRLDQTTAEEDADGQGPAIKTMSETRVWENRHGKWINVHFHQS